jgi:8-oxo-dGTP pyrophosphatase MutT (NUDIX family)
MNSSVPNKVRAYIFRNLGSSSQLLVFQQPKFPEAGTQVPGGTVDPNEDMEAAVGREVLEETGFQIPEKWLKIATEQIVHPVRGSPQIENSFQVTTQAPLPNTWDHVVSGGGEDEGLLFRYFWMSLDEGEKALWPWMAKHLAIYRKGLR